MNQQISRRWFVAGAAAALPALALPSTLEALQRAAIEDPWSRADAIVRTIRVPRFASREFPITIYGAVGDGEKSCTDAIRQAIAACRAAGGGRVVVPAGRFVTGAIKLESGVELHLTRNATLAFSHDAKEYPVVFTRWEGVELMNYSPFIYAYEAENIGITGPGTRCRRRAWPSLSACSARGTSCGRISSSRTAAATCSSTA